MRLTVRDNLCRYVIDAPDDSEVLLDDGGTDFLIVPDPEEPAVPFWLFDEILIDAARAGEHGLRMLAETPLN